MEDWVFKNRVSWIRLHTIMPWPISYN
jgi:hypothetical protein